jgi:hypothetical protein
MSYELSSVRMGDGYRQQTRVWPISPSRSGVAGGVLVDNDYALSLTTILHNP